MSRSATEANLDEPNQRSLDDQRIINNQRFVNLYREEILPGTSVEAKRNQAQRRNDFLEAQEEQRLLDEELIENGRPPSLTQQELKIQEEATKFMDPISQEFPIEPYKFNGKIYDLQVLREFIMREIRVTSPHILPSPVRRFMRLGHEQQVGGVTTRD